MPGHTGGWLALKDAGLQFCGSFPAHEERPQLYHDPVRPPNPHVRFRHRPLQAVERWASTHIHGRCLNGRCKRSQARRLMTRPTLTPLPLQTVET